MLTNESGQRTSGVPTSRRASPDRRSAPALLNGWAAPSAERQPRRSRRIPSASGRRPWAGVPVCHTAPRSAPAPADAASVWQLSLPACSASVASSCVRSIILMGERFLHFQLNRNSFAVAIFQVACLACTEHDLSFSIIVILRLEKRD